MPRHVLIMGAGLGGPALALSLARRQIKSTVFEIRPSPSSSGGSITLAANALKALSLGTGEEVYHKIRDTGYVYERMALTGDDGYRYGELCVGEEGKDGFPAVRIMRGDLHRILLDECEKAGVKLEFGKRLKEIKEEGEGVVISFEDGQEARGDILVGADGIHSQARKYVLGDAAPTPIFSKTCVVNGFVARSKVITPTPDYLFPSTIVSPSGFLMAIPVDPKGEHLAWGINTSIEEDKGRQGWEDWKASGDAARFAKANYDSIHTQPLRSLLDQIDDTKINLWAPYSIPNLPTYYRSRVCLIGDAAHALPPNGQGSAMAFEDAAFLARVLESEDNWSRGPEAMFKHYQSVRKPRMDDIRKMSNKMGGTLKKANEPDSWAWWAKKWGIWLYVTVWNRGVLRTSGFSGYNIEDLPTEVPAL